MSSHAFVSIFLIFLSTSVHAGIWQINKDHSELFFQVPYLTVSEVTGRFNKFSGTVNFPEGQHLPSEIRISIETASLDTGNRQRDGHLRSQEFLRAKTHPYMTFESSSISEVRPDGLRARGTLTIGGAARPFTINFTMTEPVKDTWNYESRFARFRSKINRKEFGIIWNKTLTDNKYLVGEEISFWGSFQLQPASLATPSSKHMIPDTVYIRKREKLNRGEKLADEVASPTGISPEEVTVENKIPESIEAPVAAMVEKKTITSDPRDRTMWQIAFCTLGLFGFFACIIIGLYTKKMVSERWPSKYAEGGLFGLLTDTMTIPLIFIYALALWEVGWG